MVNDYSEQPDGLLPQGGTALEEQLPPQQQPFSDPLAGEYFQPAIGGLQQHAELMRWLMDFEQELDRIEHFFRGERWDAVKRKYVLKGRRLMIEEGVQELMLRLSSFDHKGIIMGQYTEEQINKILLDIANEITKWIYLKWKTYNIERADFHIIRLTILRNLQAAYSRALNGGERKMMGQINKRLETVQVSDGEHYQRPRFRWFGR